MAQPLSLAELLACGLPETEARMLLPQIQAGLASPSAPESWQRLGQLLQPQHPFALHQLLHQVTFAAWPGPAPAWFPTPEQIAATNIATLMGELGMTSYQELHAWSVKNRGSFWQRLIERLGIVLRRPYTRILDLTAGVEAPQWLVGAELNIVESCFQAAPEAIAIVFQREGGCLQRWTYGELAALTNRVAQGLVATGLRPRDAIAVDLPMTPESVAIYLGIIKMGGVVVAIADSFAPPEIALRLQLTGAKAIFTQDLIRRSGKELPLYSRVVTANAPPAVVLLTSGLPPQLRPGDRSWQDFLSPNEQFEAVPAAPGDPTNILFSSGTTGEPKAIPWTQTTPIKSAADAHLHHDLHPGDVVAWPTNLGWMMGPWLIYAALINRGTIGLYEGSPTERGFAEFVQNAGVNVLGVVPSLVRVWRTADCLQGLDWSAIKAFSSTGECSNPEDMLWLMSRAAGYRPVIEYCGGTEIGGGYLTGTLVQPCLPATFTTPALGSEFVILDDSGAPADQGEAFLIPPAIGLSTELLNRDHHQVYFAHTPPFATPLRRHGDQIERLTNGYYRAHGRVDDTMNLGGIKVSAAAIEEILNTVAGIQETAAIAVPPPEGGPDQLVIYTVIAPNRDRDTAALKTELQAAIAQRLNPLFKIQAVVLLPSLPRTASNKVLRRVLRDQYRAALPTSV